MKKILLSATILSLTFNIHAQITLTGASNNPIVGETINFKEGTYSSPGSAGANQTWTLSAGSSAITNPNTFVTPSSTPQASSFTTSNVANTIGGVYTYYTANSTRLIYNGSHDPNTNLLIAYSNPEEQLQYPFTYGNSFSDTYQVTFVNGGNTYLRKGTTTVTADAYGTLTTPAGTFSNVLRVHYVSNYTDSSQFGTFPSSTDEYRWYMDWNHFPIATVGQNTFNGQPFGSYTRYRENVNSINETQLTDFNFYPNPASESINISFSTEENNYTIKLTDISGKVVLNNSYTSSTDFKQEKIDVSNFSKGIYTLKITSGTAVEVKKIIVQ